MDSRASPVPQLALNATLLSQAETLAGLLGLEGDGEVLWPLMDNDTGGSAVRRARTV
jgi:hypothetical protein